MVSEREFDSLDPDPDETADVSRLGISETEDTIPVQSRVAGGIMIGCQQNGW